MLIKGFILVDESNKVVAAEHDGPSLVKSHVKGYTRKDGAFVKEHDDKRKPATDWRDEENWHSRMMAKMKTHSEAELRYIHKDATEAAEAAESMGNHEKGGRYRDEAHYASMEMASRRGTLKDLQRRYKEGEAAAGKK